MYRGYLRRQLAIAFMNDRKGPERMVAAEGQMLRCSVLLLERNPGAEVVVGRPVIDDVRGEALRTHNTRFVQHPVELLPGTADERDSLLVLFFPPGLADQHYASWDRPITAMGHLD